MGVINIVMRKRNKYEIDSLEDNKGFDFSKVIRIAIYVLIAVLCVLLLGYGYYRMFIKGSDTSKNLKQDFTIQIPAPVDSVAYAGVDGKVTKINDNENLDSRGKFIQIEVNGAETYITINHLNSIEVDEGQIVKATDIIGSVGNTGHSFGPHYAYTIYSKDNGGRNE